LALGMSANLEGWTPRVKLPLGKPERCCSRQGDVIFCGGNV
jgi:hypothetical protein